MLDKPRNLVGGWGGNCLKCGECGTFWNWKLHLKLVSCQTCRNDRNARGGLLAQTPGRAGDKCAQLNRRSINPLELSRARYHSAEHAKHAGRSEKTLAAASLLNRRRQLWSVKKTWCGCMRWGWWGAFGVVHVRGTRKKIALQTGRICMAFISPSRAVRPSCYWLG